MATKRHVPAEFQVLFDAIPDPLVVTDLQQNIIRINPAAARVLGIPQNPVPHEVFQSTFEILAPDGGLLRPTEWPSARALRGEYSLNQEVVIKRRDTGEGFFAEVTTTPVPANSGYNSQFISSFRDITHRKQVDAAASLVAEIVNASEDAIIGKDLHSRVTSWNRGAELIFGYSAAEMLGQSIRKLLPSDQHQQEDLILARTMLGETVEQLETVGVTKNGGLIDLSVTVSPIRDAWGEVVGASKVARNITETKKLKRRLHQSQKMDALGQLTGGIAHDFNNLLSIVIGNLDLLARLLRDSEPALARIDGAKKAANRGADLTRRLLAFSSADELCPSSIRVSDAIRNVVELATPVIGPEIKIATNLDSHPLNAYVDPASFESAMLNLIMNGRDSMPNGGTVTISTQNVEADDKSPPCVGTDLRSGSYTLISVSDTGHGMPQSIVERAFEPFFTTKARSKATGLGLAMVYSFAQQSGGDTHIHSEVGHGTSVSIYLPATPAEVTSKILPKVRNRVVVPGLKVLVVDDEPELLEIAGTYLADIGYQSLKAADALSAMELIDQHPDIVLMITDVLLGSNCNGVELARNAKKRIPSLKIMYCSGFPADALEESKINFAVGSILRKPYLFPQFDAAVSAAYPQQPYKKGGLS